VIEHKTANENDTPSSGQKQSHSKIKREKKLKFILKKQKANKIHNNHGKMYIIL